MSLTTAPTAPWPGGDAPVPRGTHPLRSSPSLCWGPWGLGSDGERWGSPTTAREAASSPPSACQDAPKSRGRAVWG